MATGWLYDGRVAQRRTVEVLADGGMLAVRSGDDDGETERLSPALLRFVEARGGGAVYGREDRSGWRLGLDDAPDAALAALLPAPARYGRWIDRIGLVPASIAGVAVSAAVLFGVWRLPHAIAPLIPERWLESYGEAVVGDFGGRFCTAPGGTAALDRLVRRIAPDVKDLSVRVVNLPVVNAAALPGGNIVIFRELLDEASGPDELAGILAHEIAHVENRDVAEAMVRELGFGLIISAIGGDVATQVHQLAALSYSRDAETLADTAAIARLHAANISPAGTAKFFDRIAKQTEFYGGDMQFGVYLSTHPVSKERAAAFRRAATGRRFTPALSPADWTALRDICTDDPVQQDPGDAGFWGR